MSLRSAGLQNEFQGNLDCYIEKTYLEEQNKPKIIKEKKKERKEKRDIETVY